MATYEEYMNAARNADAAGDEAAARQLVQAAQRIKGSAPSGDKLTFRKEGQTVGQALYENIVGQGEVDTLGEQIGDVIGTTAAGVLRGIKGTLELPEMATRAVGAGYDLATGAEQVRPILDTKTGRGLDAAYKGIAGVFGADPQGLYRQGESTAAEYAGTIGEFMGGAGAVGAAGKGLAKVGAKKLGERIAKTGLTKEAQAAAAVSGLGSEAAGQATEGTELEPIARIAGAIVAPTVAARSFNLAAKPYDAWVKPRQIYSEVKTGNNAVDATLSRAIAKPSKETQMAFKNTAYREADKAGDVFSSDDMIGLAENTRQKLYQGVSGAKLDITPQGKLRGEGHIKRALDVMDEYTDAPTSLTNLDNMRQRIRSVYAEGDGGVKAFDPRIKQMLDDIDDLIETKASGSTLLNAARLGHIRTKKLEILEDALKQADREVKAGASVTQRYQMAIKKISTQKRSKSYFSDTEIAAMDRILEGNIDDKILRQFGKLSPLGGLNMMNVISGFGTASLAAAGSPSALAVTAGAIISKPISDAMIKSQMKELKRFLATGVEPTKFKPPLTTRGYGLTAENPQEQ